MATKENPKKWLQASMQIERSAEPFLDTKVEALLSFVKSDEIQPGPSSCTDTGAPDNPSTECARPFFELEDEAKAAFGWPKRIVRRACYDHMMPIVKHAMMEEGKSCGVTGTAGIGKTLFGLLLLKDFIVNEGLPVVYWDNEYAIFFTTDENHILRLDLQDTCTIAGKEWHIGCWTHDERSALNFLVLKDVYVVHDPGADFTKAGTAAGKNRTAIILSFGHALGSCWSTKRTGYPDVNLAMPFFGLDEIVLNRGNLFYPKTPTVTDVEDKHRRFGGSVRHCYADTEVDAWSELSAKVQQVANTGQAITGRTSQHKGSVVHVWVDFDPNLPIFPDEGHNTFKRKEFVLGSEELALEFSSALSHKGRQQLEQVMSAVRSQPGAEAICGALFEIHAHLVIREGKENLRIRAVRRDGREKNVCASAAIQTNGKVLPLEGREAKCILEHATEKLEIGTYIQPQVVSNFPTYDSALAVPSSTVGLPGDGNVGLLLQMTVSGASGIRRKPEHSVKQHMRKEMARVLNESHDGDVPLSVTTFCVPSVCFWPFDYQPEQAKDSDSEVESGSADYQFVVEIPGFTALPDTRTGVGDIIHGPNKRVHRYSTRARGKRVKIAEYMDLADVGTIDESKTTD